jgi:DNA-binding transcriptional regulator YiaG
MSTFANALKDEIRRIARKEVRAQTSKQARAVAQYRREIARLKRQQREQEKKIGSLESRTHGNGHAPAAAEDNSLRFSARSVRAQRRRTGFSAADYAKLVGVSPLTIYNWEHDKSRPRKDQFAALVGLRGLGKREALARLEQLASSNTKATSSRRKRRGSAR